MTRAERLSNLLREVKKRETKTLLETWKEIFGISTVSEVYECLVDIKKEIDAFELEIKELNLESNVQFKTIIRTLNIIVEFPALNTSVKGQVVMRDESINIVFASFGIYESLIQAQHITLEIEEDIPSDELKSFKENIESTIKEIEASDIPDSDKKIFLSIFYDLNKAVSLYKVSGLNGFVEVVRNNICKIKMISDSDDENNDNKKLKILTKKAIGQIWIWTTTYIKKKAIKTLESKVIQYLDENASKWAELPTPDSNDDLDDIEDAEIED